MKTVLFLSLSIACYLPLFSQDLIVTQEEEEIIAQVNRIDETHIFYKTLEDTDQKEVSIPKEEVYMIAYETGMKQYFSLVYVGESGEMMSAEAAFADSDMRYQGKIDAKKDYKKNGPLVGTMLPTILMPPLGFATGVVIAAVPPTTNRPQTLDANLLKHPAYVSSYNRKLRGLKVGKVAKGFGLGMLFFVGLVAALSG